MKTVCLYSVATHLGGGERSLLELAKDLASRPKLGYRPWVLLPQEKGSLVDALREAGIEHDVLPIPRDFFEMSRGAPLAAFRMGLRSVPGMGRYLTQLVSLLKARRPALVHTNGIKCHAIAAIAAPVLRLPVLWHLRDILSEGPTVWTLRALYRSNPRVRAVANSAATAQAFAGTSASGRRVRVVHNGLSPEVYRPKANRHFHREWGLDEATPLVGIVGILARWKGQLEFIRMAERLVRSGSAAHFAIIGAEIYDTRGEHGYADALSREARLLGIAERVHFAGYRKDPVAVINGLDALVHASVRPEPFGRVILEAMACGVPVVASAAGGVLELVQEGVNGLLFPPGDVESMALAVEGLLRDQSLRSRLVEGGRARFLSGFTLERHAEAIAGIYEEMSR